MTWKAGLALLALWAAWDLLLVPLAGVRQVTPWALMRRLERGDSPVLLDVRTSAEYAWFHIPGSRHVGFPPPPPGELGIDPGDEVVFVCMTGHRSPVAAWRLRRQGYPHVGNLTWGASAYALLGGRIVGGEAP